MAARILIASGKSYANYTNALLAAGAVPLSYHEVPCTEYEECDGLLLCGGPDVHPRYYGQEIDGSRNIDEERDAAEAAVGRRRFIEIGKPILGVCRGCQLLNILLGGTLIQDLPSSAVHKSGSKGVDLIHGVKIEPGIFQDMYGASCIVNSAHHQAIDRLGDGLRVEMYSDDGIIEAVTHRTMPYIGVQFHPERMTAECRRPDTVDGLPIFQYFLRLCKKK